MSGVLREKCGTYAGKQAHEYNGEEVCESCREAYNEYQRAYRKRRPDIFKKYEQKRSKGRHLLRPADARRDDKLRSRYGIVGAQRDEIWEWQDRRCLCCDTDEVFDRTKPWQIDHDHETGKLRGIVCSRCNRLLAQAGDTAEAVATAFTRLLAYLAASGDCLSDEQMAQVVEALRSHTRLAGEGSADPDRPPTPRHSGGS